MKGATTTNDKFKKLWKYYLLQSLLTAAALFIIVLVFGEDRMVAISAIGATAFIVFAAPNTDSARAKNVIGSHLVGLASGAIFYFTTLPCFVECPLAIGIAAFLMVTFGVVHPPAAGTALAVVINNASPDIFITVIISVLALSQCRRYLKRYLKNLV